MIKFYGYSKCSTCRKAKQLLEKNGVDFEDIDITAAPPSKSMLKQLMSNGYALKNLFNTSGQLYRQLNMKEKIKTLSESDLLDLLVQHGKLIKRPLTVGDKKQAVGFDEKRIKEIIRDV